MKLPNFQRALIDLEKLRAYVLNPAHPEGRHKARVFLSALGLGARDADWLARQMRLLLPETHASAGEIDPFGARFTVDMAIEKDGRSARVRTAWIIRTGEDFPRLVTCFVV